MRVSNLNTLRLCRVQTMVDTVCSPGHADVCNAPYFHILCVVHVIWRRQMSLGDLWARLPPPLGLGILSKLRSQLELQQVPSKSAGPPHLDLTKYLVGGKGRICLTLGHSQGGSFLGTESFSNGIVLSSDPMDSPVTSVSPGCIYCQKDDYKIPAISSHQHYDRGSNTSQIYYSLSVTNI